MNKWTVIALFVTTLMAGCAPTPTYQLSDADRAKYAQAAPEELVAALEARLKQAEKDDLPLFAPVSYAQAKASWQEAAKNQHKRGAIEQVITWIAGANSALDTGYRNKEKADGLLAPNYALDTRLQALQAPKSDSATYHALKADMNDIYEMVDSGDLAKAEKNRATLTANQQALKLKLVKTQALAGLKAIHAKLEADDAEEAVPVAVKEAVTAYEGLQAFIDKHADDAEAIAAKVHDATVLAQRAQWMAVRARMLAKIDTQSTEVEKLLVEEEKWLMTISAALGGETLRHLPPEQQAAKLAERARELNGPRTASTPADADKPGTAAEKP